MAIQNKDAYITYKEFFSTDLFENIKEDIDYNQEGFIAYGFHPSVLAYNDFNTIDTYMSAHSMDYQIKFREVIAPRLEIDESNRSYYDTWGGRTYIFGDLGYEPTKYKPVDGESYTLSINSEALKELGGEYILSRAEISNSQELGINLMNDYDSEDSLYHIFVYRVGEM